MDANEQNENELVLHFTVQFHVENFLLIQRETLNVE